MHNNFVSLWSEEISQSVSSLYLRIHFYHICYVIRTLFQDNKTALHWGAINGHKDVCALLVEAQAEVNALDNVRARRFFIFFTRKMRMTQKRHIISRIYRKIIFNASLHLHLTSVMSLNVAVRFNFFWLCRAKGPRRCGSSPPGSLHFCFVLIFLVAWVVFEFLFYNI